MPSLFIDYVLYVDHLTKRLSKKKAYLRMRLLLFCEAIIYMRKTVKSVKKTVQWDLNILSIRARLEILN